MIIRYFFKFYDILKLHISRKSSRIKRESLKYKMFFGCEKKCIFAGKWSAGVPRCEEIECAPMNIPDDALLQLIEHNNTFGGLAVFTCMWGHKLSGPQSIKCESDGRWNGSMPTCLGESLISQLQNYIEENVTLVHNR